MTNRDPHPHPLPGLGRPELRAVRAFRTIINTACGLFAVVLLARIIMVISGANPANGVAAFVQDWSAGVSLGFDNVFIPATATVQIVLNDGLAALVWLGGGWVVTTLVRRLALPDPHWLG